MNHFEDKPQGCLLNEKYCGVCLSVVAGVCFYSAATVVGDFLLILLEEF